MLYVDTSVLVASLTRESWSEHVFAWIERQGAGTLAISWLVETEVSAALSVKIRRKEIDEWERAEALAAFRKMTAVALEVLQVAREHFRVAARFADMHPTGLRTADALHLAIAAEHGAKLCTLDRDLTRAGPELGVRTLFLGDDR